MTVTDFDFICQILKQRSGLVLGNDKAYLLESRLLPVARKYKLASFEDLVRLIRVKSDEMVIKDVVEAMTTNESFFFRDTKPFDQFKQIVLPTLMAARPSAQHPHLERRGLDRPGGLFAGDDPQRDVGAARPAGRSRSSAPIFRPKSSTAPRKASTRSSRRSAACRSAAGEVLHPGRRPLADQPDDPQHGAVPGVQPADRPAAARQVRRRVLPQRADLFRPADQGARS